MQLEVCENVHNSIAIEAKDVIPQLWRWRQDDHSQTEEKADPLSKKPHTQGKEGRNTYVSFGKG
jgi:hypothetical protein